MKLSLLWCVLLPALAIGLAAGPAALPARAQLVTADTVRGLVGGTVRVALRDPFGVVPRGGAVTVTTTMQLGNPTVFYPDVIAAPAGDGVESFTLKRVNDSIYRVTATLRRDASGGAGGDTLFYLDGTALAGSDSVCAVAFRDIAVDGRPLTDAAGVVITRSVGPPLPYVRFAILEQNYPNPVPRGASTTWAYRIDKRSDVRFHFYNPLGEELMVVYLGDQDIGPHTFILTPALDMPTGAYLVRMVTNSGNADKLMMILR